MKGDALKDYYAERAMEYEGVYAKPERQADLALLHAKVTGYFRHRRVLEIACGTGYWTTHLAGDAAHVLATDIGAEVLEVARAKRLPMERVTLAVADAFAPERIAGTVDACFAGFWWSHVPLARLPAFLNALHRRLGVGARVMFVDNRYVEGSNLAVTRRDAEGNSYQMRRLANGTVHEVLKNFPESSEVERQLRQAGAGPVTIDLLPHYWCATYDVQWVDARTSTTAANGAQIRRATSADRDAVHQCLLSAFALYRAHYTPDAFADTVPTAQQLSARFHDMVVLIATDDADRTVGTIAFQKLADGSGHLRGMAVVPASLGGGVAGALLETAERGLRDAGCSRVTLETTRPLERAMRFYVRNGYRLTGRETDFYGMPLLELEKPLSP